VIRRTLLRAPCEQVKLNNVNRFDLLLNEENNTRLSAAFGCGSTISTKIKCMHVLIDEPIAAHKLSCREKKQSMQVFSHGNYS
jgi:hypothetical protein